MNHSISRRFIIASVLFFATGITSGVIGTLLPGPEHLKTVHTHINLLGFVSMMIYGLAYWAIPSFTGKKIKSYFLANVQFWLAIIGLIGFSITNAIYAYVMTYPVRLSVGPFAAMEALSGYIFAYNIIATIRQKRTLVAVNKEAA